MNHWRRALLLGACCCIWVVGTRAASAQTFTGLSAEIKTQPIEEDCGGVPCPLIDCGVEFGVDVCNVYAQFDEVFPNIKMLSVTMSDVTAEADFYQDPFGLDTAPLCQFIPPFPSAQCDTFVTVNRKNTCPGDATNTDPAFAFGPNTVTGGWFNSDPTNDQGHPQPSGEPGVSQVLIAQFAVPIGANVSGTIEVSWQAPDGGPVQFSPGQFTCIPVVEDCTAIPDLCGICQQCLPDDPGADDNGCVNLPLSTGCEADGDLCTIDHCDGNGACVPLDVVTCPGPNPPCEGGQECDPATGECVDLPDAPLSTSCEADGDLCTIDHCDGAGACVPLDIVECPGPIPPCEGGQECDPGTGECVDLPDAPLSTDCEADGDLCTIDHCDGAGGCVQLSIVECADPAGTCDAGEVCNPATGECEQQPNAPLSTPCEEDGNLCTLEHCDGNGLCVPLSIVECQGPNPPCEGGQECDPGTGECVDLPDAPLSTTCEADGDLCTIDHCDGAGSCALLQIVECQGPIPPCEGGQECDPGTGECVDLPDAPLSTACEAEGNLCTIEHCDGAGICVPLQEVICQDPSGPCDGGQECDPATGECVDLPDAPLSTACEADEDLCTLDHCDGSGSCVNFDLVSCQEPIPPCEGGQECDPASGECVDLPDAPLSTECEADENLCISDHCDGAGLCVPFEEVECPEGEICDPATGECSGSELGLSLDIRPGTCPNWLNRDSSGNIQVVLVGSTEVSASAIDPDSLLISRADGVGGAIPRTAGKHITDKASPFPGELCDCHALGKDGIRDLNVKFKVVEMVPALELNDLPTGSSVELTVTGLLYDGTAFSANDCVLLVRSVPGGGI